MPLPSIGEMLSGSVAKRLLRGVATQGYNQLATIGLQLLSAPILLHAWGVELYASWLLLTVLPTYLTLSDLGFAQASTNDMTVRSAAGNHEGALATFQSAILLCLSVAGVIVTLCVGLALVAPIHDWLNLRAINTRDATFAVMLLGCYGGLSVVSGALSGPYRAEGRFALLGAAETTARAAEAGTVMLLALSGGGLVSAAFGMLCVNAVLVSGKAAFLPAPYRLGVTHARRAEIRRLIAPSLSFMAYPVGYALVLQGALLLIGIYSPAGVVVFATARTLTRMGSSALGMINHVFMYDYGRTLSRADRSFFTLFKLNGSVIAFGLLLYLPAMLLIGPWVYRIWTGGVLLIPASMFLALTLAAAAEAIWAYLQTPLIAVNAHKSVALNFLVGAVTCTTLSAVLLSHDSRVADMVFLQALMFCALSVLIAFEIRRRVTTLYAAPAEAAS
ncbi:MAG: hypothetical protein WDM79_16335 [Terricaulis sp.]